MKKLNLKTPSFVQLMILWFATWRFSSLLANEAGPGDVFKHIRIKAGGTCPEYGDCTPHTWLAKGLYCEWCNSVWVAFVLTAMWLTIGPLVVILCLPFSMSACTIIIKFMREALENLSKVKK